MKTRHLRAFTIIELLVVVSIIALLIGILLPAIGKARDQARLTLSQTNMRNMATAHGNYEAEWNDRQFTMINDNMASYGSSDAQAFGEYRNLYGDDHPPCILGWSEDGALWGFWMNHPGNYSTVQPIVFNGGQAGFGSFRIPNARQFNQYVNGRFYDPVFYAPKDTVVWDFVQRAFEHPAEYVSSSELGDFGWSSYCLSPAAMFSPDVMRNAEDGGWQFPWTIPAAFRSPSPSQCLFPTLKTRMVEHHWLQQRRSACNSGFADGTYDGCEPYYFNHGWESVPVTLFYDGHVAGVGTRAAEAADGRMRAQTENPDWGLWSQDTLFGPAPDGGYFMDVAYDFIETSFHVLTTDGIRGRDILSGG